MCVTLPLLLNTRILAIPVLLLSIVGTFFLISGMAILNLILKPFVILLLYQMYKDRGGEYNINFGNTSAFVCVCVNCMLLAVY